MDNVKIVLKRSPGSKENGVWINGVRISGVIKVEVVGEAANLPRVLLTLIPESVDLEAETEVDG